MPCDVCKLVFDDDSPKDVRWCPICQAYLCEECRTNWLARAQAALVRGLGLKEENNDREK